MWYEIRCSAAGMIRGESSFAASVSTLHGSDRLDREEVGAVEADDTQQVGEGIHRRGILAARQGRGVLPYDCSQHSDRVP